MYVHVFAHGIVNMLLCVNIYGHNILLFAIILKMAQCFACHFVHGTACMYEGFKTSAIQPPKDEEELAMQI